MKSRTKPKARACVQPEVQISMPMDISKNMAARD